MPANCRRAHRYIRDARKMAHDAFFGAEVVTTSDKRLLEQEPRAIPGWVLEPGAVRRSIDDPLKALERLAELFSVQEFLAFCSVSIPDLEREWGKKKGQPTSQAKESFKRLLSGLITEKRNAPSLKPV